MWYAWVVNFLNDEKLCTMCDVAGGKPVTRGETVSGDFDAGRDIA